MSEPPGFWVSGRERAVEKGGEGFGFFLLTTNGISIYILGDGRWEWGGGGKSGSENCLL